MIRKTSLMLGDWVAVPGIGTGKVLEIGDLCKVYYAKTDALLSVEYYYLEPIKITPTWLKNNLFKPYDDDHTHTDYTLKTTSHTITIRHLKISKQFVLTTFPTMPIQYVHEIQHYMKFINCQHLFYIK